MDQAEINALANAEQQKLVIALCRHLLPSLDHDNSLRLIDWANQQLSGPINLIVNRSYPFTERHYNDIDHIKLVQFRINTLGTIGHDIVGYEIVLNDEVVAHVYGKGNAMPIIETSITPRPPAGSRL